LSLPIDAKVTTSKAFAESYSELSKIEGDGIVLIIDDDVTIRKSLKEELSKLGYAVAVAANRKEGVKFAYKLRPDAILLNIQMPHQEGWQILSALKNNSLLASIPVIMISMVEDKQKGYAMGATDCIEKGMASNQLAAILENTISVKIPPV